METILLLIIGVLLVGDLYFLNRIYQKSKKGELISTDEKYFELKYNINLLKAISAILIFVISFLGYSTYKDFADKITKDFNETIESQISNTQKISDRLGSIKTSIDSVELLKKDLNNIVGSYESQLKLLNQKITLLNASIKYNPRIYVINDIKYLTSYFDSDSPTRVYFKDLKTAFGENLPNFTKIPLINIQGRSINLDIISVSLEYVELQVSSTISFEKEDKNEKNGFYLYDLWIASFE